MFEQNINIRYWDIYKSYADLYRSYKFLGLTLLLGVFSYLSAFSSGPHIFDIYILVFWIAWILFLRFAIPLYYLSSPLIRERLLGEHHIVFDAEGFSTKSSKLKGFVPWDVIDSCMERRGSITLYYHNTSFYIPRREFSDGEWQILRYLLEGRLGSERYTRYKIGVLKAIVLVPVMVIFVVLFWFYLVIVKVIPAGEYPPEVKKELGVFHNEMTKYRGLTESTAEYNDTQSIQIIDQYLIDKRVKREVGASLTKATATESLPCNIPQEIEKLHSWHDGIEQLIPYKNLLSYQSLHTTYQSILKEDREYNPQEPARRDVGFLVNGESDGLGYQCGEKGLFAYYRINYDDTIPRKLFYDTSHLLQIVSQAYSRGAFYYDYGGLSIDEKRYEEISREYLSTEDSRRYSQKLSYLQKQAEHYYSSHDVLKRQVLEEIASTHDKRMIPTVKKYLKTSSGSEPDTELLHTALFTLGEIGDKSLLPLLRSYLSHDESMIRIGTLSAMGKIVDSTDEALLIDIHPLLDDDELMVQANAIELIGKIANESSLPLLLERFADQKPRVQLITIEALGRIGNPEALPLLKRHLKKVKAMDASKDESSIFKGYVPPAEVVKYALERAIAYIEGEIK